MKLELGGGKNFDLDGYLNVDVKVGRGINFVGNLLALFSPDADISDYPDLKKLIEHDLFTGVRAVHFVEHIPWIYQEAMFDWIHRILEPGGSLEIVTPNLEYFCKVYLKRSRWRLSRYMKKVFKGVVLDLFPETDHPHILSSKSEIDLRRWFNFKIFSGCSLGDYHHCLYDKCMLQHILSKRHVDIDVPLWTRVDIKVRDDVLRATAVKYKEADNKEDYF